MMVTLNQQVTTMTESNSNSGGDRIRKQNTFIHCKHFLYRTVGCTSGSKVKKCTSKSPGIFDTETKYENEGGKTQGQVYEEAGNTTFKTKMNLREKLSNSRNHRIPTSSTQHPRGKGIADTRSSNHLMSDKVSATNTAPVQHGKVATIPD